MALQGEVWWLPDASALKLIEQGVDPHEANVGNELRGDRYIVVVSHDKFNLVSNELVQALMITQGGGSQRQRGWTFSLMGIPRMNTQGVVRLDQVRTYDLVERKARYVERLPSAVAAAMLVEYYAAIHDL
jgi:mRNA-degrading endonuclease toxin of MazEF toxin-antitoxin module